ncbi:PREDICTED: uncharacterized protein LOC101311275 [Fragaria vesca subsp. vesca]|uniref:uncharacterized protein LOC101311275 n=1 Tax=Fragaria vesca subsp. vesca TaxID=101020 RepID=UPI0002C2E488|nr:PREDICTED: uncharacterized protein LOC101311275 [Fragaria vesca subsp. vesca]
MCSNTSNKKLRHINCPDWASLHGSLVHLLLDKLLEPIDHVRFAAVCKEWRAVSKDYNEAKQRWCKKRLLPMLLISSAESKEKLELYSIAEKKVYSNIKLPLPCRKSRRCWLQPRQRWLVDRSRCSRRKEVPPIHLPRLQFNHGYKYPSGKAQQLTSSKVILSGDPTLNPDSFLVLAINGHKNGHNVYSIEGLNSDWVYWKFAYGCTDAIVYKSQVYSITAQRCLNLLDVDKAITNRFLPQTYSPSEKFYLVESIQGYMLLVQRDMESKKNVNNDLHQKLWTNSFVVHKIGFKKRDVKLDRGKLVFDVEEPPLYTGDGDRSQYFKLFEVESIRDEVLFVGDNYSFSVLASDYPGCQPNSIYYTDDSMETPLHEGYSTYDCSDGRGRSFGRRGRGGYKGPQADLQLVGDAPYDMGIFNLADKSITPLCSSLSHSKTNVRPPFWTIPPFSGLC